MRLIEKVLTENPCYTAGKKIKVKGLMLHSVGCSQPGALVFIKSWDCAEHDNSCVHAFIDGNDGTIYQTLPWDHRGWHCGKGSNGSGNNTHIGVEMCEPACIEYTAGSSFICYDREAARAVVKRTYESAVELFAYLCKKYQLDPEADGVIISHREGHGRGIASNHADPEHLWLGLSMGYTMDGFRKAVKAAMLGSGVAEGTAASDGNSISGWYRVRKSWEDAASQKGAYKRLGNAKRCADKYAGYTVFDEDGIAVYAGKTGYDTYTVKGGDNLWDIAEEKLGDGTRYTEIMEVNGLVSDIIYAGQVLKLPQT